MDYSRYSNWLEFNGYEPNFFLSKEYWEKAGWDDCTDDPADFPGEPHGNKFFDHQFIYEPIEDIEEFLSGKDMKALRKQYNKYSGKFKGFAYCRLLDEQLEDLLMKWAGDRDLYAPETLTKYVFQGGYRISIWGEDDELAALLIYDENFKFINFRYCIVDPQYNGLSDYCRLLFRVEMFKRGKRKLINDGGSLGSEGLYQYKRKLKPVKVDLIYYKKDEE